MFYVSTHHAESSVSGSVSLRMEGGTFVAVNKGTAVQLLSSSGSVVHEFNVNGRIAALQAVDVGDKQGLVICFSKGESVDVLVWKDGVFSSCSSTCLGFTPCETRLSASKGATSVLHFVQGALHVVDAAKPALFSARLAELNLKDAAFLHSTQQLRLPRLALLHTDPNSRVFLATYSCDRANANIQKLNKDDPWANQIQLQHDAFKLLPVKDGAVLVFAENMLSLWRNAACVWEMQTDSVFTGVAACVPSDDGLLVSDRVVLADSMSDLYLLDTSQQEGNLTRLGHTSLASSLSFFSPTRLYLGSHYADSQLLDINTTTFPSISVLQTYANLAPIVDFVHLDASASTTGHASGGSGGSGAGQSKVVACCGAGESGSLRVLSNGVGLDEAAEMEGVEGVQGMWAAAASLEVTTDSLLLLSFVSETKILCADASGSLSEYDPSFTPTSGLLLDEPTLAFGNVAYDQILQVTASRMVLMSSRECYESRDEWVVPESGRIVLCSMNANQIVAAVGGSTLMYFEVEESAIMFKGQIEVEHEVSCLDISCLSDDATTSPCFVAGMWTDGSVRVFSTTTLKECAKEVLGGDHLPRSLKLCTLGTTTPTPYLLIGLGDGHLVTYTFDAASGTCANRKTLTLGTQPIHLVSFHSQGKPYVLAASDLPSVVYGGGSQDRLMCSNLNLKSVTTACQFRLPTTTTATTPSSGLAIATATSLKLGSLDSIQKLHLHTIPLDNETPRRIAHVGEGYGGGGGAVAVLAYRVSETGDEVHCVKVLEDQGFETLATFTLPPLEMACSICPLHIPPTSPLTPARSLWIVGTAHQNPTSPAEDPLTGRVVALEYSRATGTLEVVCSVDTKGCVYAVHELRGAAVIATVGTKVQVYQFTSGGGGEAGDSLVATCAKYGFIQALYLSVKGDVVAVGDLMKSVTLLEYHPGMARVEEEEEEEGGDAMDTQQQKQSSGPTLTEVARDYLPTWTCGVHLAREDLVVVGEVGANLYTLRRQKEVQLEEERKRLEVVGAWHLGGNVTRIRGGSLATSSGMDTHMASSSDSESMLFCTTNGHFGSLLPLSPTHFRILTSLSSNLGKHLPKGAAAHGNLSHDAWRTFVTDKRRVEAVGYIDGDFVQQFVGLSALEREEVVRGVRNGGVAVEVEGGVEEVLALLEELEL
ncbi:DNA damage-binding protein 1a [Podochytrium sp. JEL0797]|nr:DNA damage-binding protein 1a [Podochytrium sp. JEL0797]